MTPTDVTVLPTSRAVPRIKIVCGKVEPLIAFS